MVRKDMYKVKLTTFLLIILSCYCLAESNPPYFSIKIIVKQNKPCFYLELPEKLQSLKEEQQTYSILVNRRTTTKDITMWSALNTSILPSTPETCLIYGQEMESGEAKDLVFDNSIYSVGLLIFSKTGSPFIAFNSANNYCISKDNMDRLILNHSFKKESNEYCGS